MRSYYTTFIAVWLVALPAYGQSASRHPQCGAPVELTSSLLSDSHRALWRTLTLMSPPQESGLVRSASIGMHACADSVEFLGAWQLPASQRPVQLLPVQAAAIDNSAYPRSVNDGAAWLGKGWTLGTTLGARAHWRFLTAALAPEFYYQTNEAFSYVPDAIPGASPFANPYQPQIDDPSRFGAKSFSTASLGQSYLRADAGPVAITVGKENLWMGAADVYPILMSYTAPGFPHLRIASSRPLELPYVSIEFQLLFASLHESDYFDIRSDNDTHYYTTALLVLQPTFLSGLSLGLARAYHDTANATGHGLGFYTSRVIQTPFGGAHSGNQIGNALGVLMARWVLPESRFEAYAEWSREDTPGGWIDVLREPDWTQAYVLGFAKAYASKTRLTRVYGELVHLGESAPARAGRGFFSYYTHSAVIQGHTNGGQMLGAAIGPGSDAQLLGADFFTGKGMSGLRIERTRYDDDTYYRRFARQYGETGHDAEISVSASHSRFFGPLEVEAGLAFSRRYGRQFLYAVNGFTYGGETNWSPRLRASWRPTW